MGKDRKMCLERRKRKTLNMEVWLESGWLGDVCRSVNSGGKEVRRSRSPGAEVQGAGWSSKCWAWRQRGAGMVAEKVVTEIRAEEPSARCGSSRAGGGCVGGGVPVWAGRHGRAGVRTRRFGRGFCPVWAGTFKCRGLGVEVCGVNSECGDSDAENRIGRFGRGGMRAWL